MVNVALLVLLVASAYGHSWFQASNSGSALDVNPADVKELGCPKIEHPKNVDLKKILGQWHLPYLNSHWGGHMAKTKNGKLLKESHMGQICIKVNVKDLPAGTSNNTDATIWLQSKCPHSGSEWNLACAPQALVNSKWRCGDLHGKTHDSDSLVLIADTDNKTWALVVRCFPDNGMNWAIFSKVKQLPKSLVIRLFRQVENMGFKIFNTIEVPYEKCLANPL